MEDDSYRNEFADYRMVYAKESRPP